MLLLSFPNSERTSSQEACDIVLSAQSIVRTTSDSVTRLAGFGLCWFEQNLDPKFDLPTLNSRFRFTQCKVGMSANVNAAPKGDKGLTALQGAANHGNLELVRFFGGEMC